MSREGQTWLEKSWGRRMKKTTTLGLVAIHFFLIGIFFSNFKQASAETALEETIYLPQGWDHKTRQTLYTTSFGSRLIPYPWFIALEQADRRELFRDNRHMASLGFITAEADEFNPHGLPVGLVRDVDKNGDYIGITCTACHTGQASIRGQRIRIDGGQALIDLTEFEKSMLASLRATLVDKEKFSRFAKMVVDTSTGASVDALKGELQARIVRLEKHLEVNRTSTPYGKGRLDAFGQIFNAIAVGALETPENSCAPDAPVSYPVLWDASHLDTVQWNGSAPNKEPGPLVQNTITALAVYGNVSIVKDKLTYQSSVRISSLADIQREFYQLVAPQWPAKYAGELDAKKLVAGKVLYEQHCVQCHTYVNPADSNRNLKTVLIPVTEVGTDPVVSDNFETRKVKSGVLEGRRLMIFTGDKIPAETRTLDLVINVAAGTLLNQPWQTLKAIIKEYRPNDAAPNKLSVPSYKARPINGIWASAPYLHNGSVPTIYDLLLPVHQRPITFHVGNIELDLVKIGYVSDEGAGTTFFDTRLRGNSNAGHEYGTQITDEQRWALLEYIKSL